MNGLWFWGLPCALQGLAMGVDELGFHRRRPVPRWEWLGHLLDTLVFMACLAVAALLPPAPGNLRLYAILAAVSCLVITKDEFIHQKLCPGGEHWLHAVLFVLHPMVLGAVFCLWTGFAPPWAPPAAAAQGLPRLQLALAAGFLALQAGLGLVRRDGTGSPAQPEIDNSIYEELGERWYSAGDDPVALLRAESRLLGAWVRDELRERFGGRPAAVLDVACGAGFLANPLAAAGHAVTGIDLSPASLAVARRHDATGSVDYRTMDARALAFPDGQFDAVCMMDFLEHLEERDAVLREAARVLKPGGWLCFHTFNRTPASWLIAIKGVEWFVRNTPRHMHVHNLFLKPEELARLCERNGMTVEGFQGVRPRIGRAFLRLLLTRRVDEAFGFQFTRLRWVGYCGWARRF
jgi:2-polyprenyl-6-hydroxyphenyl methylase/3-demethylubiquinone-9 3-methyltransferase